MMTEKEKMQKQMLYDMSNTPRTPDEIIGVLSHKKTGRAGASAPALPGFRLFFHRRRSLSAHSTTGRLFTTAAQRGQRSS